MPEDPTAPVTAPATTGTIAPTASAPAFASSGQPATAPPEGQSVPYERFREVNDRLKNAEQERDSLQAWRAEQERAAMSETERLTTERDQALQRAAEAEGRVTELERGGLVAAAARKAGFADPDDAAAFIDLASIEDTASAEAAVADLGERKPHLLKSDAPAPTVPAPIGGLTSPAGGEPPIGQDGKPDARLGLGRDLLASLTGPKR